MIVMRVNGMLMDCDQQKAIEELMTLHTATAITTGNETIPCEMLVAVLVGDVQVPTLSWVNGHTGRYDPETEMLIASNTQVDNGNKPYVVYTLPNDHLCCERMPEPNEKLLKVTVTSHRLSKIIGDSNCGTHTHTIVI